jgi:glutamate synthase (NADPH/NADH) small chain
MQSSLKYNRFILSPVTNIHYNAEVGRDLRFSELLERFDAVFFSSGLTEPNGLGGGRGNHLWVLEEVTRDKDPGLGQRVAAIDGSNLAMDVARVSRRLGAEVTVLHRRRIEDMPADPEEIHETQAEQVRFVTQAIPVRVEDDPSPEEINIVWGEARMVADDKGCRHRRHWDRPVSIGPNLKLSKRGCKPWQKKAVVIRKA